MADLRHHAYYIEDSLSLFDAYKQELKPFWAQKFERFGIEDARELTTLANLKNVADSTFLLGISAITIEAQQALLKLFEEPQRGTAFILLVPHGVLLPTLRSRMLSYPRLQAPSSKSQTSSKFLKLNKKERSEFVAKLLKDEEGAKEKARELINALERELSKKIKNPDAREALQDIGRVRDYLRDRSPSLKMLLEHLAVSLPKL